MSLEIRARGSALAHADEQTIGRRAWPVCSPRGTNVPRWAVILAGGDGRRLLPLTRRLAGDDRPKQFCKLLGTGTLLEQTLKRVSRVADPNHIFSVVTNGHETYFAGLPGARLIQPCNRGTAPAILYSLLRLHKQNPQATVGFFPSDHHFADDEAFAVCAREAFEFAEIHRDLVVLLGIKPSHAETGYGWIEPGEPMMASGSGLIFRVRGFWEKPSAATATELIRRGCFWNSFVIIGRIEALLNLIEHAIPHMFQKFQDAAPALFTSDEDASILKVYQSIPSCSFSKDVLCSYPLKLAVFCSKALEWTDVGEVDRALALMGSESGNLPDRLEDSSEPAVLSGVAARG